MPLASLLRRYELWGIGIHLGLFTLASPGSVPKAEPSLVSAVDVAALALGAAHIDASLTSAEGNFPSIAAVSTCKFPHRHFKITSFYPKRLSLNQGLRHFSLCRSQNPVKRRLRNIHEFPAFFLPKTLSVVQAYSLQLFHQKADLF